MKIFVTGATGCLGHRVVLDLLDKGHDVNALSRPSSNRSFLPVDSRLQWFEGDLTDEESLSQAATDCTVAIHCAASLHYMPKTQEEIQRYENINVGGTKRLLEACRHAKVQHVIHMGSIASMGDFYDQERDETWGCTPESFYGKSKLKSEETALSYHSEQMAVTVLRPGVIYGAHDRGTVLKMIRYIDEGKFRFIGDGNNFKSLVSVGNVSAAALAVMHNEAAYNEVFLIVDKEKLTIRTIAQTMADKLDTRLAYLSIPLWVGYALGVTCDYMRKIMPCPLPFSVQNVKNFTHSATYSIAKLKKLIGFEPSETFMDTIEEEVQWYKAQRGQNS